MTSTEFNVGLGEARCSSRVLKPPGGGHTNIFAEGQPDPVKHHARNQNSEIKGCFHFESEIKKDKVESERAHKNDSNNEQEQKQKEKATPEKKTEQQQQQQQPPPPRVRVPPGGFSSGLW